MCLPSPLPPRLPSVSVSALPVFTPVSAAPKSVTPNGCKNVTPVGPDYDLGWAVQNRQKAFPGFWNHVDALAT